MDNLFRLDGKNALITGAASGIGFEIAKLFAERGANVCILDIREEAAKQAAQKIAGAFWQYVDVGDTKSISQAVSGAIEQLGVPDILINSAGIGPVMRAENFTEEAWDTTMCINLRGTFFMSQQVGREMIEAKKGGKIVCLASQAGMVAIDEHVAYSASKAGIISMVKSLAYEWGKYGIQVNAVSPTATETPLIKGYWDQGEIHRKAIENLPSGRFARPEEIAAAALFLASSEADMITGANLVVDGGYTIH